MIDPNRLNRVHVVTVRNIDGKYHLVLSDGSMMTWHHWINGGQLELSK